MTDYTLTVDTSDITVVLTDILVYSTWILYVDGVPDVVVSLTPFRNRCHEWFYVLDGSIESLGIKTIYRMGATISGTIPIKNPLREPFVAIQCLVFPEDVNQDERFRI